MKKNAAGSEVDHRVDAGFTMAAWRLATKNCKPAGENSSAA
jgi:hypothetical protein